ncbi:MAG: polysaccharide deacetylase family protein [Oscillochloridaceae bacterium umkhey_bin13]
MTTRLSLSIDPALEAYRPELSYTWRTLLSALGYAWVEQPWGSGPTDLAYLARADQTPTARLVIRANPQHWAQPARAILAGVEHQVGWSYPRFRGEAAGQALLTRQNGALQIERDLIFDCFWLLSGQDEAHHPKRKHGYLDLRGTPTLEHNVLRQALVSTIGTALAQELASLQLGPPLPRWPGRATLAAACGHDVDYPEVIRWIEPLRILARQGAAGLSSALAVATGNHSHWHFRSWMELERTFGARSAFYFVARQGSLRQYATGLPDPFYDITAPPFRALFRELATEGWEIGLHASYLAYRDINQFAAERERLATASGQPIYGNRHHYWHLDEHQPAATLLLHEQLGLHYDASLTHNGYLGWRRGSNWPFYPWHAGLRRPIRTLQLPTAWMDDQLFSQRANNPGDRASLLRGLVNTTANHGGLLLVDVHEYVYDEALFPGWATAYRELWAELYRRGAIWFATPYEVANHWARRQAILERASLGLEQEAGLHVRAS